MTALKWRKWPDEKPEKSDDVFILQALPTLGFINETTGAKAHIVWTDHRRFWIYESELLATLPKGEE